MTDLERIWCTDCGQEFASVDDLNEHVSTLPQVECGSCEDTGMMLSDAWVSWHDDHGTTEEPPKYVSCEHLVAQHD